MSAKRPRNRQRGFVLLASVSLATVATGCGHKSGLLTTTDVRKAFAHQGLSLVADKDKAPRLHFLRYGTDGGNREHMAVFVYDEPTGAIDARNLAKQMSRAGNISETLVARNVVVAVLPQATADERRRVLKAIAALT